MKRLTEGIELPTHGPLSAAATATPDYSRWFVCSTVDHALFLAQSQGKFAADKRKLKPNVGFCPPATERPIHLQWLGS